MSCCCCFGSSAVAPDSSSRYAAPKHLIDKAIVILGSEVLNLSAALDIFVSLSVACPGRLRCNDKQCQQKDLKHLARFCHPCDPDWGVAPKSSANGKPPPDLQERCEVRWSDPFGSLSNRLSDSLIARLNATPSASDVLAEVTTAPDQETMDGKDPLVFGVPLVGHEKEKPCDLAHFVTAVHDSSVSGQELCQKVAFVALANMALDMGLLRPDRPDNEADRLLNAIQKAGERHLAWARQRSAELGKEDLIYALVAAHLLCLECDQGLSQAYRKKVNLPELWDLTAHVLVCSSASGTVRAAWYALADRIAGAEGDLPVEEIQAPMLLVLGEVATKEVIRVAEDIILYQISGGLPSGFPLEDSIAKVLPEARSFAEEISASASLEVLRKSLKPIEWWDVAVQMDLFKEEGARRLLPLVSAHLTLVAGSRDVLVLRRALYIAFCIEGLTDALEGGMDAISSYVESLGLTSAWDVHLEFDHYGSDWGPPAMESLKILLKTDRTGASSVLPDAAIVDILRRAESLTSHSRHFVYETVKRGLNQVPPDGYRLLADSFVAAASSHEMNLQQLQALAPPVAWWFVIEKLSESWVRKFDDAIKDQAHLVLSWALADDGNTDAQASGLMYALFNVITMGCYKSVYVDASLQVKIEKALELCRTTRGIPKWWDISSELLSYGIDAEYGKSGLQRGSKLWASTVEILIACDASRSTDDVATKFIGQAGVSQCMLVLDNLLMRLDSLPENEESFVSQAKALSDALIADMDETNLQQVLEVISVCRLFTCFQNTCDWVKSDDNGWPALFEAQRCSVVRRYCEVALRLATEETEKCALFIASSLGGGAASVSENSVQAFYRSRKSLPDSWNVMGAFSMNQRTREAWLKAEGIAGSTVTLSDSTRDELRQLCSDGFPYAVAQVIAAQMGRMSLDDTSRTLSPFADRWLNGEVSVPELEATITWTPWWDLAKELFLDTFRDVFVGSVASELERSESQEEETMEDQLTQVIKKIFKACDADKDGLLSEGEHYSFGKLAGFRGNRTAWARAHGAILSNIKADSDCLTLQSFVRVLSASERFTYEYLLEILGNLQGHSTICEQADEDDNDSIPDKIGGGAGVMLEQAKGIEDTLQKAKQNTTIGHIAMVTHAMKVGSHGAVFLRLLTRQALLVAIRLNCQDIPTIRDGIDSFRKVHNLPQWFDVLAAVSGGRHKEKYKAWNVAEEMAVEAHANDTIPFAKGQRRFSWTFLDKLQETMCDKAKGCDKEVAREIAASVFASLLKHLPLDADQECDFFISELTHGRGGSDVRSSICALALLDINGKALSKCTREDGSLILDARMFSIAAKRHLSWAATKNTSTAALYGLFVARALCSWAMQPVPMQFGVTARRYCKMQGINEHSSSISSLLDAYGDGILGDFIDLMEEDVPDLPDRVDELLTSLVMLGNRRSIPSLGDRISLPRFEQIEAACQKAMLTDGKPDAVLRKMESEWRRIAGERVEVVGFYLAGAYTAEPRDQHHLTIRVKLPESNISGGSLDLGADVLCERILDATIKEPIMNALATAMLKEPSGNESIVFGNLLRDEADGEELRGAVHVVRMWEAIQRLGLHNMTTALDAKKQAVQHYLSRSAWCGDDGNPDEVALRLSLFIGVCLNVGKSPLFLAASEAYRRQKGLPDSWDVEAMMMSYTGKEEARRIWMQVEAITAQTCSSGDVPAERWRLMSKMPPGGQTQEPWRCLLQLCPAEAPAYWDHAGQAGQYDEMVAVGRSDPLGNPSSVYASVQQLLDNTWKFIATRDRPCPRGMCKPEAGGCACVKKDGDPGMPKGIRVRSVIRVEDSERWHKYLEMKKRILAKRRKADQRLQAITLPFLGDRNNFEELDASINELYLLHGTYVRAALSISQTGFSIDLAGDNVGTMYGPGAYLTECSSKADEYAKDEPGGYYKGVFAILICRVLMGNPYITEDRDDQAIQHYHAGRCDSTMGDREKKVGTYREFVVYDQDQVYPEYCVLYERLGKWYEELGAEGEWGALRREISKVVMEVPAHWQNVHVNPNAQGFSDVVLVSRALRSFLESFVMSGAKSGEHWSVFRAHRVEDSATWIKYLETKKSHQQRGPGACTPISTALEESGMSGRVASEKALVDKVLVNTRRPRCKYGDACFRKNAKHRLEMCHPGDSEWDEVDPVTSPKSGKRMGLGEAEMAARLLESVDQSINEIFLWQSTNCTAEAILENGLRFPSITSHTANLGSERIFYETAAGCLNAAPSSETDDGMQSVVLCRVLCGNVEVLDGTTSWASFDGPTNAKLLSLKKKDSLVAMLPDDGGRVFAAFSSSHVYPEYVLQLCQTDVDSM